MYTEQQHPPEGFTRPGYGITVEASIERPVSAYPVQPRYTSPSYPPYMPGQTTFDTNPGLTTANLNPDDWFDIFLSYRHTDAAVVERISDRFKQAGFKVWRDMEGGNMRGDLLSRMRWAIDNSKIVVPIISREYCSSDNCKFEFGYAMQHNKVIFPITLADPFKELRNAPGYADIAVGVESNICKY
ncbi:Toll/interleukin-1 receptor homology domain-containing protein [Cladochytrium replicatum]|nr:Toll/interleukin-1 receptor homology domain-containing protein [Cladochytrium replicatum]